MKILVTGSAGMLGHDLMKAFRNMGTVVGMDLPGFDICNPDSCRSVVAELRPDWIVNAAAFTAVDECESVPDKAMAVNAAGAENLADAARECGARMVHISTDYVFNGDATEPYREGDLPDPRTVYGRSKLEGERRVLSLLPDRSLVVRTAWLFGPNGRNFVDTILKIASEKPVISIVDDQSGCPTFTRDLASGIEDLIRSRAHGIVHLTNSGFVTWYGFASYFLRKTYPGTEVKPVSTNEFPRPAPRPKYSVMSMDRFHSLTGRMMPHWRDAVDRYLAEKYPGLTKE